MRMFLILAGPLLVVFLPDISADNPDNGEDNSADNSSYYSTKEMRDMCLNEWAGRTKEVEDLFKELPSEEFKENSEDLKMMKFYEEKAVWEDPAEFINITESPLKIVPGIEYTVEVNDTHVPKYRITSSEEKRMYEDGTFNSPSSESSETEGKEIKKKKKKLSVGGKKKKKSKKRWPENMDPTSDAVKKKKKKKRPDGEKRRKVESTERSKSDEIKKKKKSDPEKLDGERKKKKKKKKRKSDSGSDEPIGGKKKKKKTDSENDGSDNGNHKKSDNQKKSKSNTENKKLDSNKLKRKAKIEQNLNGVNGPRVKLTDINKLQIKNPLHKVSLSLQRKGLKIDPLHMRGGTLQTNLAEQDFLNKHNLQKNNPSPSNNEQVKKLKQTSILNKLLASCKLRDRHKKRKGLRNSQPSNYQARPFL